jgi:hypothetical protein
MMLFQKEVQALRYKHERLKKRNRENETKKPPNSKRLSGFLKNL